MTPPVEPHAPDPQVAPDGVRCGACDAPLYQLGTRWTHTDPGPPNHEAAFGLPVDFPIQHKSGDCAWCDAMRWRDFVVFARTRLADRGAVIDYLLRLMNDALLSLRDAGVTHDPAG